MKKGEIKDSDIPDWHLELVDEELRKIANGSAKLMEWAEARKHFVGANGVPAIPGDISVDISDFSEIISSNKMDAKKLMKEAVQHKK